MTTHIDRAESDAYLAYQEDGLADLFIGLGLMLFGLGILTDLPWIGGVMAAVLYPVWVAAKQAITAPRAAYIEDLPSQATRARRMTLVAMWLGLLVLLGFAVFWLVGTGAAPTRVQTALQEYFTLWLGAIAAVTFGAIALAGEISRYYAYGGLVLLIFAISHVAAAALYWPLAATALVLILGGLWLLTRFMRTHPACVDEGGSDV